MPKFYPTNPTIGMLCDYIKNGEMAFDNPIQRGLVWKRPKKSLLIHSTMDGYIIPPIYANLVDGIYDVFDGKQRCNTLYDFVNNKFSLYEIPDTELEKGTYENYTGKKFSELPSSIQSKIKSYTLSMQYGERLSQDDVVEQYIRLNSGKPLSATEMTKAQIKSVTEAIQLTKHPLFNVLMNNDAKESSKDLSFVMQAYVILRDNNDKCLLNSKIKQLLHGEIITQDDVEKIAACFDIYLKVFERFNFQKLDLNKKIILTLKRKSHFTSVLKAVDLVRKGEVDFEKLINWLQYFFNSKAGQTTISSEYNEKLTDAMNSSTSVKARLDIIGKSILEYNA